MKLTPYPGARRRFKIWGSAKEYLTPDAPERIIEFYKDALREPDWELTLNRGPDRLNDIQMYEMEFLRTSDRVVLVHIDRKADISTVSVYENVPVCPFEIGDIVCLDPILRLPTSQESKHPLLALKAAGEVRVTNVVREFSIEVEGVRGHYMWRLFKLVSKARSEDI